MILNYDGLGAGARDGHLKYSHTIQRDESRRTRAGAKFYECVNSISMAARAKKGIKDMARNPGATSCTKVIKFDRKSCNKIITPKNKNQKHIVQDKVCSLACRSACALLFSPFLFSSFFCQSWH